MLGTDACVAKGGAKKAARFLDSSDERLVCWEDERASGKKQKNNKSDFGTTLRLYHGLARETRSVCIDVVPLGWVSKLPSGGSPSCAVGWTPHACQSGDECHGRR